MAKNHKFIYLPCCNRQHQRSAVARTLHHRAVCGEPSDGTIGGLVTCKHIKFDFVCYDIVWLGSVILFPTTATSEKPDSTKKICGGVRYDF